MNYVWAQRETEEHREESETIAVPFLDLKEKEESERGFKTGKCGREIKSFGRRRKRQKRNGLLRKYPYSINAAHSVLRCSHFRFTASTFWQKKSSLFNLADKLHDESTFLSLCFCLYSPCRRLRFISKAL